MLVITLPYSLTALITCSHDATMLTFTFTNLFTTLLESMSIIITSIMKPPLQYNVITLFKFLLRLSDFQLDICLTVTNFFFLAGVIMNSVPLKNIKSVKPVEICCYSYVFFFFHTDWIFSCFLSPYTC